MKKSTLKNLIKEIIRETQPKTTQPKTTPQPITIPKPTTTPDKLPKRRTLVPPKEAPSTKPKAESIGNGEKDVLSKIVKRYASLK